MSRKPLFRGDPEIGQEMLLPYGNRWVRASVVNGIGGFYKPGYSMHDAVFRTESGEYFLVREIERDQVKSDLDYYRPRFKLPGSGYWLRVKRLSLRAALAYVLRDSAEELQRDVLAAATNENTLGCHVPLDDRATELLRRYLASEPKSNLVDAVNGCVICLLECQLDDHGRSMDEVIAEAASRRLNADTLARPGNA